MQSINPATGELIKTYTPHSEAEVAVRIEASQAAFLSWRETTFAERAKLMRKAAELLRQRKRAYAELIADEMGKVLKEGEAEIEKCAAGCDYYAGHAESMLRDEVLASDAKRSLVSYQPLGVVLAVMPWNFPFWQVFRFAAPNLMAGNVGLLKHASNVSGCALEIERVFHDAGFPQGCFSTLLIGSDAVATIIEHPHVRAVTLTGSEAAGRAVAAKAGGQLKKTVLELGGSDPYVILPDADIAQAAEICAQSRLINAGQSCIAAKRFIVHSSVCNEFEQRLISAFTRIRAGNPKTDGVHMGPLARTDLRDALHAQVEKSIAQGAVLKMGGKIPAGSGAYYPPTLLSHVRPGMAAFDEELFGPVAALIEAKSEDEAFALANATSFGLGSALFTRDTRRGEMLAKTRLEAGQAFVNALVRSDPRLPFGGIKASGYGRELGLAGLREFVNVKTVYIA